MEIKSLHKLSSLLGVSVSYIKDIANRSQKCYHPYKIQKLRPDGTIKERCIDNPNIELKTIQKKINSFILVPVLQSSDADFIHGARKGRSICTNAQVHVSAEALLSLDLKDCFPNIKYESIYNFFAKECGCIPPVARTLTKLTTYNGHLPQGSPASPSLCNLILLPTMRKLHGLANSHNLSFTQFVDDLFFSGSLLEIHSIHSEVLTILRNDGWQVNKDKDKIRQRSERMKVTGVTINQKMSVGRKHTRRLVRDIMKLDSNAHDANMVNNDEKNKMHKYKVLKGKISHVSAINVNQGFYLRKKFSAKIQ